MVSLCGRISGLTIADDQHLYIYDSHLQYMLLSDWFHERRTVGFGFHKQHRCLGRSSKPQTLHFFRRWRHRNIPGTVFCPKIFGSSCTNLASRAKKKKLFILFFASSLRLFFFRGIYDIFVSQKWGFVFWFARILRHHLDWTTCWSKPLLVFIFQFFGLDLHFSEEMSISCSFLWWCTWVRPHPCTLAPFELSPLWAFWTLISNMGAVHHDLLNNDHITKCYPHAAA